MKKTVVFDFDGVIHKYSKGYQDGSIYDSPNENIKELIDNLRTNNYEVVVVSTRCNTEQGIQSISKYLADNNITVDKVCKEKPPAMVYIDDRAICYDPLDKNILNEILKFKPNQKVFNEYNELNDLALLFELKSRTQEFEEINKRFDEKHKGDGILSLKILDEWINTVKKYL